MHVWNRQLTVFWRKNSTFRKQLSKIGLCCGPSLEYCVRVWRKLIWKWPRNTPNWPRNMPNKARLQSSVAYTISEKGIWFRHLDYDPDRAQKLISSSMSQHLSTRKISSSSMHAFLSNLANRQTDKRRQSHLPTTSSEVITESKTIMKTSKQSTWTPLFNRLTDPHATVSLWRCTPRQNASLDTY